MRFCLGTVISHIVNLLKRIFSLHLSEDEFESGCFVLRLLVTPVALQPDLELLRSQQRKVQTEDDFVPFPVRDKCFREYFGGVPTLFEAYC